MQTLSAQTDSTEVYTQLENALILFKAKKYEEAFTKFQLTAQQSKDRYYPAYIEACIKKGSCKLLLGQTEEAARFLNETQQSLQATLPITDSLHYSFYPRVARIYGVNQIHDLQVALIQQEIDLRYERAPEDTVKLAEAFARLGYATIDNGETREGITHFKKALDYFQAHYGPYHVRVSQMYSNLSFNYQLLGEFDKQLLYTQKALEAYLQAENQDSLALSHIYFQLGNTYQLMGNYRAALPYAEQARNICLAYPETNRQAQKRLLYPLQVMALCYQNAFNFEESISYTMQALNASIRAYGKDNYQESICCTMIAQSYSRLKDTTQAMQWLDRARDILDANGMSQNFNSTDIYIYAGFIYKKAGLLDQAYTMSQKALEVQGDRYGKFGPQRLRPKSNLAEIQMERGHYEEAMQQFKEMLILFDSSKFPIKARAATFSNLGRCFFELKEPDSALHYIHQSVLTISPEFLNPDVSAQPPYEKNGGRFIATRGAVTKGHAFQLKYELTGDLQWLKESLRMYLHAFEASDYIRSQMVSNTAKLQFLDVVQGKYQLAIGAANELYELTNEEHYLGTVFSLIEQSKGFLLREDLAALKARNNLLLPDSILDLEYTLQANLAFYESKQMEGKNDEYVQNRLRENREAYKRLKQSLETQYPEYYRELYHLNVLTLNEARQSLLESDELMLSYFIEDTFSLLLAISSEKMQVVELSGNSDSVDTWIHQYRHALANYTQVLQDPKGTFERYTHAASQLYEYLFPDEVKSLLPGKSRLVIIPDGSFHHLSFDALLQTAPTKGTYDYGQLDYLGQSMAIQYAPSATILNQMREHQGDGKGYLGMAPEYDPIAIQESPQLRAYRGFQDQAPQLKGTLAEVSQIQAMFEGEALVGASASESAFKKMAGNFALLHLALHALTNDENPMESKLIFAQVPDTLEDNFLAIHELFGMKLNADLAVLSACNTGYGKLVKGEGPMSLAYAFSYAGCPSVVMSKWRADDEATAELMVSFFTHLQQGMNKSQALLKAKQDFFRQADPVTRHPYFWANFSVVGSDAPLPSQSNSFGWKELVAAGLILLLAIGLGKRFLVSA